MADTFFSLVVYAKDTNEVYYRDLLESLIAQTYGNWELYILDEGTNSHISRISQEFFPNDERMHYRKLKTKKGGAYAYNIGFHFVLMEATQRNRAGYLVLVNQHDRLQRNTLEKLANATSADVLYTDHDELIDHNRMHPHFKPELSVELLRHVNYIGDFFAIRYESARKLGEFKENLQETWGYDYLLRAVEAKLSFRRVSGLLYHKRMESENVQPTSLYLAEAQAVVEAHLIRSDVNATVNAKRRHGEWEISYNGSDVLLREKEYLFLKEEGVHLFGRRSMEKMYGILKQKDVAVVGVRTTKRGFRVDSNGYIFDRTGMTYPAFHETSLYEASYDNYGHLPREVSMVDSAICMIDSKYYRKLGGFDKSLSGRDVMLDFCLRAREKGLRIVVDPRIVARVPSKTNESSEMSRKLMFERYEQVFANQDPFYNPNLYLGMRNFSLDADDEDESE